MSTNKFIIVGCCIIIYYLGIMHNNFFEGAKMEEMRVGSGYDAHKFGDEGSAEEIVLCGVKVPYSREIVAHSDGDVALHTVTDAILGSFAGGDIGELFPSNDERWRGKDSSHFLIHAHDLLKAKGGRLINVDVTIVCQAPKVGPHRLKMRERLAEILDLDVDRVSVKATTTDRLGFTGRGEGIEAHAVVCVGLG